MMIENISSCSARKIPQNIKKTTYRIAVAVSLLILPALLLAAWLLEAGGRKSYSAIPMSKRSVSMEVPMKLDLPGNTHPGFVSAMAANLDDRHCVIGVSALGQAKAYSCDALSGNPENHVVHDLFGEMQVTITYCNRTQRARFFSTIAGKLSDLH
jgi:hypothetical protein